jgi:hypothetical protein
MLDSVGNSIVYARQAMAFNPAMLKGTLAVVLLCSLIGVGAAPATSVSKTRVTRGPNATIQMKSGTTNRIAQIRLDNVPLREMTDMLRNAFPGVNIIVTERAATETVSLQLKDVDLKGVMHGLVMASNGRLSVNSDDPKLIQIVSDAPAPVSSDAQLKVFNLSRYLNGLSEDQVKGALQQLEEVVELSASAYRQVRGLTKEAGMERNFSRFHAGTKLLIVAGPPEFVQVYETVVKELQGSETTPR